ncbi:MAG: hydroxymethylbilane synthase, partial [Caldilineae bacterium]
MTNPPSFTFGTRGSALARRQTDTVAEQLRAAFPQATIAVTVFSTRGDRELDKPLPQIGGKGLFTAELEAALREGRIDLAVHSLKDLPTEDAPGLTIGAILPRQNPADVLISRDGYTLKTLPAGATVGTSSLRRAAQLLAHRPDLRILPLRGNVDTRLKKALDPAGPYDAILLAAAGLNRMGLARHGGQQIPFAVMLPAPGQGAIAVQCRAGDETTLRALAHLDHLPTRQAVLAERAFLAGLGGGCSVPVGALGAVNGQTLTLHGVVAGVQGKPLIRLREEGSP